MISARTFFLSPCGVCSTRPFCSPALMFSANRRLSVLRPPRIRWCGQRLNRRSLLKTMANHLLRRVSSSLRPVRRIPGKPLTHDRIKAAFCGGSSRHTQTIGSPYLQVLARLLPVRAHRHSLAIPPCERTAVSFFHVADRRHTIDRTTLDTGRAIDDGALVRAPRRHLEEEQDSNLRLAECRGKLQHFEKVE